MSYTELLALAVSAARNAGQRLREEFYRPGGPRGTGGHAQVDAIAETTIRAQLREGTPEYGIVGEELPGENVRPRDPGSHVWLIDPNDGTALRWRRVATDR